MKQRRFFRGDRHLLHSLAQAGAEFGGVLPGFPFELVGAEGEGEAGAAGQAVRVVAHRHGHGFRRRRHRA